MLCLCSAVTVNGAQLRQGSTLPTEEQPQGGLVMFSSAFWWSLCSCTSYRTLGPACSQGGRKGFV